MAQDTLPGLASLTTAAVAPSTVAVGAELAVPRSSARFKWLTLPALTLVVDYNVSSEHHWCSLEPPPLPLPAYAHTVSENNVLIHPGAAAAATAVALLMGFGFACVLLLQCAQLLEGCFLVSAVLILVAGMVFTSGGFPPGSTGYRLLSIVVALTIIVATLAFLLLLGFEIYRSLKLSEAHGLARRVEEEAVEEALLGRRRRSTVAGLGVRGRRRSSVFGGDLQREASLARRVGLAFGGSHPRGELWVDSDEGCDSGSGAVPGSETSPPLDSSTATGMDQLFVRDHPSRGNVSSTAAPDCHPPPPPPRRSAPVTAETPSVGGLVAADAAMGAARSARVRALKSSRESA
jgi:hypothetical protein